MAKKKSDYFGLAHIVSIILAIIPPTAWICGTLTRFQEKKYVAAIIRLFGVGIVLWVIDLYLMIKKNHILRLLNI